MILVYGTACIDDLRQTPRLPVAGGYVEVDGQLVALGGEAVNTALALRSWGREVELVPNATACDDDGERLRAMLSAAGFPPSAPNPRITRTPRCEIFVTPDGERTMFGYGFRDMLPDRVVADVAYQKGEWFTAEPNMRADSREVLAAAARAGMRCYAMDFADEYENLPEGAYWQSSTDCAARKGNVKANVEWLKAWIDRTRAFSILSDGSNGFVAGSPAMPARIYSPYPPPIVVDATGAGDIFRAGMLYGLDQNMPTANCLRFASAAGCLQCRSLGATTDIPTVAEIEAHIAAHPEISQSYE